MRFSLRISDLLKKTLDGINLWFSAREMEKALTRHIQDEVLGEGTHSW
jgi:hypothetical protein